MLCWCAAAHTCYIDVVVYTCYVGVAAAQACYIDVAVHTCYIGVAAHACYIDVVVYTCYIGVRLLTHVILMLLFAHVMFVCGCSHMLY